MQLLPEIFKYFKVSKPKRTTRSSKARARTFDLDNQALLVIWQNLSAKYFPLNLELATYKVKWSSRKQKRVLGSCSIRSKRISIAPALSLPACERWLEAVLYHEMCHAVLGDSIARLSGRRAWHGPEFKLLESQHPDTKGLKEWMRSGGWHMAVKEFHR